MKKIDILPLATQGFYLSPSFKQNIAIIQMSQMELLDHIENEIDLNPLLIKKKSSSSAINMDVRQPKSLYEDLMDQAAPILNKKEQEIAKYIFGNLSNEGFISNIKFTRKINKVLKKVQNLEPAGICALNLKDALLIQLARKNKQESISYQIIEKFFNEFLHRKWKKIAKYFQISIDEIKTIALKDIAPLNLRPAEKYQKEKAAYMLIDIYIKKINKNLEVTLNQNFLPTIAINKNIDINLLAINKIYQKNALNLIENLYKRDDLLLRIGKYLIKHERQFFLNNAKMKLLSISDLAKFCNVHKSTIHRCLKNKYLHFSNHTLPLTVFFKGHKIPQDNILIYLKKIVENESKEKPLSDLKIMQTLKKQKVFISRRAVTKYREKLKIPPSNLRKII